MKRTTQDTLDKILSLRRRTPEDCPRVSEENLIGDLMDKKKRINVSVDHGESVFFTDNVTIVHNQNKFIIDFSQTAPRFDGIGGQVQQTMVIKHKALVLDPSLMKIFLKTLGENVKNYEKKFGKIPLPKKKKIRKNKIAKNTSVESSSRYIG